MRIAGRTGEGGTMQGFADRRDAGHALAERLAGYRGRHDVIALGLARGGMPVADVVARQLGCALDVLLVRKLGAPDREELAIGAIASRGVRIMNPDIVAALRVTPEQVEATATRELRRIEQQEALYRGDAAAPEMTDRVVILVDDGVATGATMAAAVAAARVHGAARVVAAAPVGAREARVRLEAIADEVVFALEPESFEAVGAWYDDFTPTSDEEVRELLRVHGIEGTSTPRYRPQPV